MDRRILVGVVLLATVAAMTNCGVATNDGNPYDLGKLVNPNVTSDAGQPVDSGSDAEVVDSPKECHRADTVEALPGRTVTHVVATLPDTRRVFVEDMFGLFRSLCGGCHVDGNQGGWQVTRLGFNVTRARESLLAMLRNDSLDLVMPPQSVGGKLAKERGAEDPSVELVRMLRSYIAAGGLPFSYEEPVLSTAVDPATGEPVADPRIGSPYRIAAELANAQTTLGNCIPDKGLYATETEEMLALDEQFNNATPNPKGNLVERIGLPQRLQDTDLFTFEAAELAKRGVLAWAPAYPAFVDGARAIRHVRVPTGESIAFDKATQQFKIPDLTRFYKTLLKPVIELDGSLRWRKTETQLIVVWQDNESYGTGFKAVAAIFGSYVWNDDETEAILVTDPLKNGEPFRDHMLTYISDEPAAAAIIEDTKAKGLKDPGFRLLEKAAHHYVVPGSRRCVECHMGSPSKNFVLGFQPLQIKRRPVGQGGIREQAGPDELTQIDRFIAYKLLTGITSADDITNLEDSEGARKPRNEYELNAQAYFLASCADCHNPRGAATQYNAALKSDLDLLPSQSGGIFQFPLERYSATIARGGVAKIPIAYITPSLFDIPRYSDIAWGNADRYWKPKCVSMYEPANSRGEALAECGSECSLAPWRSLIYRGVDTPFTYSDDLTLYPSMPMHTPGFDCSAPRIVAEWMVSIPSRRKVDSLQYKYEDAVLPLFDGGGYLVDKSSQPYLEVKPGEDGYGQAESDAIQRLAVYRGTQKTASSIYPRYEFCPGNSDIVDQEILKDSVKKPVPTDLVVSSPAGVTMTSYDSVPDNVHWVILDPTLVPGVWYPRRSDWSQILVDKKLPELPATASALATVKYYHEKLVVDVLQSTKLTDTMRVFAAGKRPMGVWKQKAECDFTGVPKVSAYAKAPPAWMKTLPATVMAADPPVYLVSPGEFVYSQVCAHCHGTKADSAGREASTLATMTGGYATVTSFRAGIGVEENRINTFQPFASDVANLTADDWAARYYAWMGLGGTKQTIPDSILSGVATADVLGNSRPNFVPPTDANMLSGPEDLCKWTLPANSVLNLSSTGLLAYYPDSAGSQASLYGYESEFNGTLSLQSTLDAIARVSRHPLINKNGDEELWQRLCALDNPRPVRVLSLRTTLQGEKRLIYFPVGSLYAAESYPADAPVADQYGRVVTGVHDDNLGPWCLRSPNSDDDRAALDDWRNSMLTQWRSKNPGVEGALVPYCPIQTKTGVPYISPYPSGAGHTLLVGAYLSPEALLKWSLRGAVNAGLATYVHVDAISQGIAKPTPDYNACEQRGK